MSTEPGRRGRVTMAFGLLTFIWGASFLWIKLAVAEITPQQLVAYRLVFGLLGLVPLLAIKRPPLPRERRVWIDLAILGLINSAAPWFLISWAEQSIDSALATVLNGTTPLFTILFAHRFLSDDRMTTKRVLGLLLGFAGVVALSQREPGEGAVVVRSSWMGQAAMLGATALYGASGVFARRRLRQVSALVQSFFSMLTATIVMWAVLLLAGASVEPPQLTVTWVAVAWLGVLGAGIASYLFYFMLHAIGPTRASLITYTIPVVGVALGVLILKERLDLNLVLGTVLIVAGVGVVNRR